MTVQAFSPCRAFSPCIPTQLHALTLGPGGFEVQWSVEADADPDDEAWATPLIGPNRTLYLETFEYHVLLAFQGPQ